MKIRAYAGIVAAFGLAGPALAHGDGDCVGYEELAAGDDVAALAAIETSSFDAQDPAKLINEAVALARTGQSDAAQARFEAAVRSSDRVRLETATGEWVDSRWLAMRGLAMLESGAFQQNVAMKTR